MSVNYALWRELIASCELRGVDPAIVTEPGIYRDQVSTAVRRKVILDLRRKGYSGCEIMLACPIKPRTFWRIKT